MQYPMNDYAYPTLDNVLDNQSNFNINNINNHNPSSSSNNFSNINIVPIQNNSNLNINQFNSGFTGSANSNPKRSNNMLAKSVNEDFENILNNKNPNTRNLGKGADPFEGYY